MKGEIHLQFIKISLIILLSIYVLMLLIFSVKSGKTLKTLLLSALSGLAVMVAVNLTERFTGISIAVNGWTVASSALLGIPGVLGLLTVRLFF